MTYDINLAEVINLIARAKANQTASYLNSPKQISLYGNASAKNTRSAQCYLETSFKEHDFTTL
jgi:hypothetical protein